MKKMVNAIVFAQAEDSKKAVVANRYVAHALYTQNKALVEELGGTVVKGVGGFRAEFKTAKTAKNFIAQAITHIDADDYAKARKTEPTKAKGKANVETVTIGGKAYVMTDTDDGFMLTPVEPKKAPRKSKGDKPTTAPNAKAKKTEPKVTPRKSKGNVELTDAQKKTLDRMKMSVLNRAASAYSVANGGETTTFKELGKSEKDLAKYIPDAKAGLLKSKKWAKAVEMGITEDMLG